MKRTITVTGAGEVAAKPDLAEITVTAEAADRDYRTCVALGEAKTTALRCALAPLGFEAEDLKTREFQVFPQYEGRQENGVYTQVFTGYSCTHRLTVRFPLERERLAAVIDAVTASGADAALNIRFTVKDAAALVEEALAQAVDSARRKAAALCAAAGVTLGALLRMEYRQSSPELYSPTDFAPAAGKMLAKNARLEMDVHPEDVSFTESATLIWAIE